MIFDAGGFELLEIGIHWSMYMNDGWRGPTTAACSSRDLEHSNVWHPRIHGAGTGTLAVHSSIEVEDVSKSGAHEDSYSTDEEHDDSYLHVRARGMMCGSSSIELDIDHEKCRTLRTLLRDRPCLPPDPENEDVMIAALSCTI